MCARRPRAPVGPSAAVGGVFCRHPTGSHFQTVVDLDATPADAPSPARGLAWLVAEGIVRAERTDCVLGAPLGHPPLGGHRTVLVAGKL